MTETLPMIIGADPIEEEEEEEDEGGPVLEQHGRKYMCWVVW